MFLSSDIGVQKLTRLVSLVDLEQSGDSDGRRPPDRMVRLEDRTPPNTRKNSSTSRNSSSSEKAKMTRQTLNSANNTVWRKTSHPPLNGTNQDDMHKCLQLQWKNSKTKDDWATVPVGYNNNNNNKETNVITPDDDDTKKTSLMISPPEDERTANVVGGPEQEAGVSEKAVTPRCSSEYPFSTIFESPRMGCPRTLLVSENLTNFIKSIMEEAKKLMRAETCSFFLFDRDRRFLVSKLFDRAGNSLSELRVPAGRGVVGRVATTRTMMNVREAHRCPFFYPNVDEQTGFKTKNILCFPIIDSHGQFVGVAELCNKKGAGVFTRRDEQCAKTFAVYCATTISHCLLYKKVCAAHTRTHMAAEMIVHGTHVVIEDIEIARLAQDPVREWQFFSQNFNQFSFAPRSIGEKNFHRATMTMFEDLGFTHRFRMSRTKLAAFVLRVSSGYRDAKEVPYHNWSHAFSVTHFAWLSLRTRATRLGLDELERLAMLISCLCHDIDHRGTTNLFQIHSKTPLAALYGSEGSVLERHHYAQTMSILHTEEYNLLDQLTAVQFKTVLANIREIILATDVSVHLKKVDRIRGMVNEGYNPMSRDHHYLFMSLLMTASDLSDQSKPFHNAKEIAGNIYKEFFAQGDLEKELGQRPSENMDRATTFVPESQYSFMNNIAIPVYEMLAQVVPDCNATYRSSVANRGCWLAMKDEIEEGSYPTAQGFECLHDDELEQKVLERVRQFDPEMAEIASGDGRDHSEHQDRNNDDDYYRDFRSRHGSEGHMNGRDGYFR